MSERKNSAAVSGKKASKDFFQGRMLSLEFFKRNWVYAVFVVVMALARAAVRSCCPSRPTWPMPRPIW